MTPLLSATPLHMHKPLKLDYLWAAPCILGEVYFMFRSPGAP